jgi:hypothetical protein
MVLAMLILVTMALIHIDKRLAMATFDSDRYLPYSSHGL